MKFSYSAMALLVGSCLASPIKEDTLALFELQIAQSNSDLDGQMVRFDHQGRLLVGQGYIAEGFFEPDANGAIMSANPTGWCLSTGNGGILQWSSDIHDALGGFAIVQQMLDYSDSNEFTACPVGNDYFISLSTGCTDGVKVNLGIVNIVQ